MSSSGAPRHSKTSLSGGTPESLSDTEGPSTKTPRKFSYRSPYAYTPSGSRPSSRPSSRSGSRPGSKPPSRHGSNLSLDSTDDITPSRIPTRRTPLSGRTSSTAKKLEPNGGLPRPRTPTGLTSVTSTRSRIPVYVGSADTDSEPPSTSSSCSISLSTGLSKSRSAAVTNAPTLRTPSRTRTPSGSNTPVSSGSTTATSKLLKKPTGTSETSKNTSRKSSITKEPFRL
ncbi:mediator of RNA polymerase II transcription subunit 1 isoform X1 [Agrilus planipennis]|uniref:Mediator of RNA polymerase II transcription subunit 1 isoform X1 n=1 Tax=Agrilus planipennis TaxID=224129 RepID=A0A7F5R625_AGRPL|nr:mediator of RNA polymerase II transcription subunit 1 isoform X1 [Agrilus planipennis]